MFFSWNPDPFNSCGKSKMRSFFSLFRSVRIGENTYISKYSIIYLEPKCPLFWLEKDLLLEVKQRTNAFQVYIYIYHIIWCKLDFNYNKLHENHWKITDKNHHLKIISWFPAISTQVQNRASFRSFQCWKMKLRAAWHLTKWKMGTLPPGRYGFLSGK